MSTTQIGDFPEKNLKKITLLHLTVNEYAALYVFIFIKKIKTVFRKTKLYQTFLLRYWYIDDVSLMMYFIDDNYGEIQPKKFLKKLKDHRSNLKVTIEFSKEWLLFLDTTFLGITTRNFYADLCIKSKDWHQYIKCASSRLLPLESMLEGIT